MLMFIKYLFPTTNFVMFHDFAMTLVLNIQLFELEKLEESQTLATKTKANDNGIMGCGHIMITKPCFFPLATMCSSFQKHARNVRNIIRF